MAERNINSSMQLPDANSEVEIEAIVPHDNYNVEMNQKIAEAAGIMEKKIEKISSPQNRPFIYRVYKKLRDVNEKAYEPVALAIGPYHRDKEHKKHLQMMEEHKWRYLKALLVRRPDIKFEHYISAIAQVEQGARNSYAEPVDSITSAEFIEMLVLDGCFIIELLQNYYSRNTVDDPIFQTMWIMDTLARDMLLFENQIPFFVLRRLFDLIHAPNQLDRLIKLVLFFFQCCFPVAPTTNISSTSHDGKLFGRITRPISLFIKKQWTNSSSQDAKDEHDLLRNYERSENQYIFHILDLVHSNWSRKSNNDDHANTQPEGGFQFIPSATDLRDANVKFHASSQHDTMFDVVFDKGTLSIPPLIIIDRTEPMLRSLIVYEQFFPLKRNTNFTAYAWFLDCLVNSSADVTLLSQCGIIQYLMGDNEVVAKIFNEITTSTSFQRPFAYAKTFHLINTHYKRKKNRAIANLKRNYFNSPWAYISFSAGLLLLSLTVAQTVLSALQLG